MLCNVMTKYLNVILKFHKWVGFVSFIPITKLSALYGYTCLLYNWEYV